jgi:serine protease
MYNHQNPRCFTLDQRRNTKRSFNHAEKVKPFSGFVIVRLSDQYSYLEGDNLKEFARKNQMDRVSNILEKYPPKSFRRSIKSVSVAQLKELERKAQQSELPPVNSLSNYWRLDYRHYDGNPDELIRMFQEAHEVETAYKEMSVTDPLVNPADDVLAAQQGYVDAAPDGIDARWAWTQPNSAGIGVGLVDLEQGWIPGHEDLAAAGPTLVFNDNRHGVGTYIGYHGTAVLGEIIGVDNTRGVVGIAPSVSYVRMVSHYEAATNTALHVADAIVSAITNMNAGDVLLLEVQRSFLPTETDSADFDAIRLAVANGIVVVEAAGNGNEDLDAWVNGSGLTILNRGSIHFRDSGAIMVGASVSTTPHDRASFSNFGSRIDCYAWGEDIVTAGYSNRGSNISLGGDGTATLNDDYTSSFGGTSGASPIIVGAALTLQGMYKATALTLLSPLQMRSLLSDPATGTPQGGGVAGNIGVMPDLRAIIEHTLEITADVYMRDYVGDIGTVPSAGAISASPDIIVTPTLVANPTAAFGEGSGTENSNTLGYTVEFGQDNYIYARIRNRGGSAANGVTSTVYWSEVATLVTPDMWHLIGTSNPVNVPVGDTMVVTDAVTWPSADIPAEGHYCFVGILNHAQDAAPPIPAPGNFDWNDFTNFIRNYNNVTWRNFNVVDVDPSEPSAAMQFNITGAPDKRRIFDIELIRALPENAQLWLEVPLNLFAFMNLRGIEVKADKRKKTARILLPHLRKIKLCNMVLPKGGKFKCQFIVSGGKGYENGMHHLAIGQSHEGLQVGRITWALRGNRKTK